MVVVGTLIGADGVLLKFGLWWGRWNGLDGDDEPELTIGACWGDEETTLELEFGAGGGDPPGVESKESGVALRLRVPVLEFYKKTYLYFYSKFSL